MKTNLISNDSFAEEQWSAKRIKELTMSRIQNSAGVADANVPRHSPRRFAVVAIAAILILSLATTALAVSGIIDFGRFYNSIFLNPEASPYVSTDKLISIVGGSDELLIEPLAGFIGGEWNLYIQLKLTALNDVPLPEALYILDGDSPVNIGDTVITKMDERTAIISFRTHSGRSDSQSETISLTFNAVSSVPYRIDNTGNPDTAPIVGMPGSFEDAFTYFGDWEVLVSANSLIDTKFIEGSFEGHNATVRVEATVIEFQIFADYYNNPFPFDIMEEDKVTILLSDGLSIHPKLQGTMYDSEMAAIWYAIDFINPADVIGIEFCGVTLYSQVSE
jgi:hypothetical protein